MITKKKVGEAGNLAREALNDLKTIYKNAESYGVEVSSFTFVLVKKLIKRFLLIFVVFVLKTLVYIVGNLLDIFLHTNNIRLTKIIAYKTKTLIQLYSFCSVSFDFRKPKSN